MLIVRGLLINNYHISSYPFALLNVMLLNVKAERNHILSTILQTNVKFLSLSGSSHTKLTPLPVCPSNQSWYTSSSMIVVLPTNISSSTAICVLVE